MTLTNSWPTVFIALSVIFWALLYFYFTRKFNYWKNKNVPYVPPLPFFGNALDIFTLKKSIGEKLREIYASTSNPFIGIFICDDPCLLIRDPELAKAVLIKDFGVFNDRSLTNNKKDDPMGSHMLFLLKNPEWRDIRRKMTPVFTSGKLKSMYKLIEESGEDFRNYLRNVIEQDPIVDIREATSKYTTDAITSTAFGINANCFKNENAEFRVVSRRVFNFQMWERGLSTSCYFIAPNLVKFFKLKFVDSFSSNFLREAFWRTMDEREKNKIVRNDLLDILIGIKNEEKKEDDGSLKLEGDILVAQATQFFIAGYETTSTTISFMLYELAINRDIQTKLREEIRRVERKYGEISYDALNEMEYLDLCLQETLRLYPILPFLDRRCNVDYTIPGTDIVLNKGTSVFVPIWGLHCDPEYFPNPEKFDPGRFTPENVNARPPFTYLPFGTGPRNCIGMRFGILSAKSGIARILSDLEVELCEKAQHPVQFDPKGFLLAPVKTLYLSFKIFPR